MKRTSDENLTPPSSKRTYEPNDFEFKYLERLKELELSVEQADEILEKILENGNGNGHNGHTDSSESNGYHSNGNSSNTSGTIVSKYDKWTERFLFGYWELPKQKEIPYDKNWLKKLIVENADKYTPVPATKFYTEILKNSPFKDEKKVKVLIADFTRDIFFHDLSQEELRTLCESGIRVGETSTKHTFTNMTAEQKYLAWLGYYEGWKRWLGPVESGESWITRNDEVGITFRNYLADVHTSSPTLNDPVPQKFRFVRIAMWIGGGDYGFIFTKGKSGRSRIVAGPALEGDYLEKIEDRRRHTYEEVIEIVRRISKEPHKPKEYKPFIKVDT